MILSTSPTTNSVHPIHPVQKTMQDTKTPPTVIRMKKTLLLILPLFFLFVGCEDKDTTPPTVSISSHSSGQTVNEVITITVTTQDYEGISRVEFFIDDSLVFTDTESPYQYDWNTTTYDDTSYTVKVISYDTSDNFTESEPITLVVDNRVVYLWGEYYSVLNTTELDLYNNQLTGSIPPEIGNLTNLTDLYLFSNDLTGVIPESICDLNVNWSNSFNIYNNQLCSPYPSCIEDYVGEQDTTNCDQNEKNIITNNTSLLSFCWV